MVDWTCNSPQRSWFFNESAIQSVRAQYTQYCKKKLKGSNSFNALSECYLCGSISDGWLVMDCKSVSAYSGLLLGLLQAFCIFACRPAVSIIAQAYLWACCKYSCMYACCRPTEGLLKYSSMQSCCKYSCMSAYMWACCKYSCMQACCGPAVRILACRPTVGLLQACCGQGGKKGIGLMMLHLQEGKTGFLLRYYR